MGVYHLLAIVAAAVPLRAFAAIRLPRPLSPAALRAMASVSAVTLVVATLAYFALFAHAVYELPSRSALGGLPVVFLDVARGEVMPASRADALLWLVLLESGAFAGLLAGLRAFGARARMMVVAAVAVTLAAGALAARAADSPDPYLYAGIATLGLHAYAPPNAPFAGDLRAINGIWGTPLFPCAYGPVWVALSSAVLAPFAPLGAKLIALRVMGLASVALCALLVRRLGASATVVAAILCNPALYGAYVADAHNDLAGVDAVLLAMVIARKNVVASFPFAVLAAFVKLTLAPIAFVALMGCASLRTRAAYAVSLCGLCAAAYAAFGGAMWHALRAAAGVYTHPVGPFDAATRFVLAAIGLGTAGWIVLTGRVRPQSAWAPVSFGDNPLPQYFAWGLPLAVLDDGVALAYFGTLPFITFLQGPALPATPLLDRVSALAVVAVIAIVALRLRPATMRERYIL